MSQIKFTVRSGGVLDGKAKYINSDSSFDFEKRVSASVDDSAGSAGMTSLLIGTLQIEIDVEHRSALHVWGYHPREAWTAGKAVPPPFHGSAVVITSNTNLIPGVSLGLAEIGEWTTTYDETSGWVSVRSNPSRKDDQTVLIASNTLLGLIGESLNAVWVKPVFL